MDFLGCLKVQSTIKQIRRTRAKSQPIAATRLLCSLQYPVQAKSSASDLSFPIFEIAIRRLMNKDIVALNTIATCHAVLGCKQPILTRLPTGKGRHRRFLARILT